jgi:predicted  nucleic acid-binding Zn-ribbon protein
VSADKNTQRSYVETAQLEFEEYAQNLLRENEKLRAMTTMLESDSRRLHLEVIEARRILAHKEDFRRAVQSLESDRQTMTDELAKALKERDSAAQALEDLRAQLVDVEEENVRYAREYQRVKNQSNNLFNLYIASYQLHASVDRKKVLESIQEIIINLIGSEELAIWELDGAHLTLADSFGIDAESW